ncbi:hypothetical protein KsCSTR_03390 [Candidatus Kuenenia stuttgartiensis]|uniref:Uncharacterized protein n=1 Tax=Kuenenia stuttgartiensis TaxID=174633 RepID=Q1PXY0_KUEST|nr:hypothetical protein KsCSTR_03390 [Candidatus Kuenenia stuttgartiensis]CAJ72893.1 unknown protein [Candidatus Kuenenia stuttgartiensis]
MCQTIWEIAALYQIILKISSIPQYTCIGSVEKSIVAKIFKKFYLTILTTYGTCFF